MNKRIKNLALTLAVSKIAKELSNRYSDDQIVKDAKQGGKVAKKGGAKGAKVAKKGGKQAGKKVSVLAGRAQKRATARKRAEASRKRKRVGVGATAGLTLLAAVFMRGKRSSGDDK